jgi:hypothetical protein
MSNTPSARRRKKRGIPFSRIFPRGLSSAEPGAHWSDVPESLDKARKLKSLESIAPLPRISPASPRPLLMTPLFKPAIYSAGLEQPR